MGERAIIAGLVLLAAGALTPAAAQETRVPAAEAFAELARLIYDAEPAISHAHLLPFRSDRGGPGDCDTELRAAVADAMVKKQADTLSGRRLELRQGFGEDAGAAGHAVVQGRYGVAGGQIWAEVSVVGPGGVIAAALPRRVLTGLLCKGDSVSLIQAAEARAGIRPDSELTLAMRVNARIGDAVTFDIKSGLMEPALPLCLNLAGDNTAQVVTPLRRTAPALKARGTLTWPTDFARAGLSAGPFCYDREQNDAVICFAMRNAANPALARLWSEAWPEGAPEPRELSMDQALELVAAAAETDGAATVQRYRVGPRVPGAPSACRRTTR
ncbi:MAG: hypothetical protein ACRCTI_00020 [Beijerinckiaceae bacterium]